MAEIKWTEDQKRVIESRNKNLLVSASAGSGKTTVMISRVLDLMIKEQVPISKFLIVTFTKASAVDMKQKLITKLQELEPNEFVLEQIDDVATSDISDLHSFYSKLISTYFYELDIDPKLKIVDEVECSLLKDRAINRVFEKREKESNKEYFELFDFFQKKRNDKTLKNIIYQFDNFLNSTIDGDGWFYSKLESAYEENIDQNVCANSINHYVASSVLEDIEMLEKFAFRCHELGCESYGKHFDEIASNLKAIAHHKSYLVNAKNIFELEIDRTPSAVPEKLKFLRAEAKTIKDEVKKNIENYKKNYVSANEDLLKAGLKFGKKVLIALFDLVKQFNQEYAEIKKEINSLDFNDLERFALKILDNSAIVQAVRDKYKYIFVDEYQDINEVQEYIISKISSNNNRFMVGDVKQSIYGFRLCDPEIFLQKYKEYLSKNENSEVIPLNSNFRSDKHILKFVDDVFSGVMTPKFGGIDYAKDSKFVPGEDNLDKEKSVNLCFIDTTQEKTEEAPLPEVYSVKNHVQAEVQEKLQAVAEANFVANAIFPFVDKRKKDAMKYSDIAVLVASRNAFTEKFIEVLQSYGIPVSSDAKYDLLSKNYIEEILNFAKIVVNDKDDILLFKVLKSKLFRFTDNELVEIRKLNMHVKFAEAIFEYEKLENDALKQKIKGYFDKLEKFKTLAGFLNLKEFVKMVIQEFSLYQINYMSEQGAQINEEIDLFVSKLPEKSVAEFVLNYEDFEIQFQNECAGDTVKIMTIHKSKGIEFKVVFLVNTANEFNMQSTFGSILFHKDYGVGVDFFDYQSRAEMSTIPMSAVQTFSKRKLVEEQQRVLYVALTRAKEKLFVVCSKPKEKVVSTFPKRPRAFISWFEPMIYQAFLGKLDPTIGYYEYKIKELSFSKQKELKNLMLKPQLGMNLNEFEYKFKESSLVPLKSSVSKILHKNQNNYSLKYEEDENKILSEEFVSSADRGTLYHKLFQFVDLLNLNTAEEQIHSILVEKFSENERKQIDIQKIKKVLQMSVFKEIEPNDKILAEREFYAEMPAKLVNSNAAEGDTFILQGVIDLIIAKKDGLVVLDYKTGKITDQKIQDYKFQLDAYANVAERAFKKKVLKKYLLFVDEEKLKEI